MHRVLCSVTQHSVGRTTGTASARCATVSLLATMRAGIIGHLKPCMTNIYLHIDARMADYIRTHPQPNIFTCAVFGTPLIVVCHQVLNPATAAAATAPILLAGEPHRPGAAAASTAQVLCRPILSF